jgi:hypothetical protein
MSSTHVCAPVARLSAPSMVVASTERCTDPDDDDDNSDEEQFDAPSSSPLTNIVARNIATMMRRRDYRGVVIVASPSDDDAFAIHHNITRFRVEADDPRDGSVIAVFVEGAKVTIEIVRCLITTNDRYRRVIVAHENCLTPDARSAIAVNRLFTFETHSYDDLSYDPIAVVPRHYRVTDAADIGPGRHKFPVILASDVICRYFAFVKGDVVAIDEDFDGGPSLSYRRCV